jgi:hypothetical protein
MSVSTANIITLKGSTDIVTEFFEFSVNSILYQRAIYPPESFKKVPKYGLAMMLTTDEALSAYITNIMTQMRGGYFFTSQHFVSAYCKSVTSYTSGNCMALSN